MGTNEQSENAIKKLIDSFIAAWNLHDARAFAETFAPDADFTNVFGMRAEGRDAIEQFHAPIFETMFRDSCLSETGMHIRFLRPEIAAIDVCWEMTGARDPEGRAWPLRRGLMNLIVIRVGAEWSIAVMHNMDLPSEEVAKAQEKLQGSAVKNA